MWKGPETAVSDMSRLAHARRSLKSKIWPDTREPLFSLIVWSPGSIRVCWCCCLWAHSKLRFCLVIWTIFLTLGDFEKASFGNVLEQEPRFFSLIFWTYKTGIYCVPQRWFSTSTPTAVLPLGELHPESGRDCCVCQIRTHVHAHFDSRKRSH